MIILDTNEKIQQATKDLKYRLNSMMAYDIYNHLFEKYKCINEENGLTSIYHESHIIDPALEISIVFGRQLLDFLQIGHNKATGQLDNPLIYKRNSIKPDDLFLSSFPGITKFPLADSIVTTYDRHIKSIIKVANKASAHMTFSHTTDQEFLDIKEIKPIIFDLCLKYIPNITHDNLWWFNRDSIKNAYMDK